MIPMKLLTWILLVKVAFIFSYDIDEVINVGKAQIWWATEMLNIYVMKHILYNAHYYMLKTKPQDTYTTLI